MRCAVVWEAAGYPWSVRLKALLPMWLPWIRSTALPISPTVEEQLLRISPRQMDRRLGPYKKRAKRRLYGTDQAGDAAQAPHPIKDGPLGREPAGLHGDRPGVALGRPGRESSSTR